MSAPSSAPSRCQFCNAPLAPSTTYCGQCGRAAAFTGGAAPAAPGAAPSSFGAPVQRTSGLAIAALITSLIPCVGLIGAVLGMIALSQIKARPQELKGRGLAIAGIVIGSITIVLGILGMLAAIAIPNFIKFQARAKESEAKANLKVIALQVQEAKQGGDAPSLKMLEPHRRYAYWIDGQSLQPDLTHGVTYQIPEQFVSEAQKPEIVGVAVGNLDSDPTLDVWMVEANGALHHVQDDVKE